MLVFLSNKYALDVFLQSPLAVCQIQYQILSCVSCCISHQAWLLPLTLWWSMMMIMVIMMTTMVMMMVPSDPMTCARSSNVTPELIEPHIKPNRSWASNPSWNLRHDEYDDVRGQTRSNFLALRVQMLHSGIFDCAAISQDWDIDAADDVFLSRGYESGDLLRLSRTSTLPEIRFWQEVSRELCRELIWTWTI